MQLELRVYCVVEGVTPPPRGAIERHAIGAACVLPIILSPVDWENTPFSAIQILPSGGKPVTLWPDLDEALRDVARGVKKVVDELSTQKLSDVSLVKQANLKHRRNTSTIFQDKETQRRYLRRTLLEPEKLILKGIPARLIAHRVRLD